MFVSMVRHWLIRSRVGAVVRALASHQCGPGSIPGPDAISGLSLCWFSTLLRGFFSGFSDFPPPAKTSIQLIPVGWKLCSKVIHGPHSGCQRRHSMLSVRNCWAASLLYSATTTSETFFFLLLLFNTAIEATLTIAAHPRCWTNLARFYKCNPWYDEDPGAILRLIYVDTWKMYLNAFARI